METIVGGGPATVIHDQQILTSETRLVAELGMTDWFAADLVVPVRVFHTSIRYLDTGGQPVSIENPYLHHHNETLTGPGDPWLIGRAARRAGAFTFGGRLGVALPLGRTEPDPFVLGDEGLPHEHSQFGTGTFEPLVGADVSAVLGGARVELFALTIQSLYANGHGYQAGDRYAGGAAAASSFGTSHWRFRSTVEAQHETAERWHGIVHTSEGNIGRTDVLAGFEATWRITDDWHLGASIKLPVYTHVEGGQVDASPYLGLSIGTQLHVFEHHHPAPKPPDLSGARLVPVPGKITVFDYWATWCEPCHVVDRELAEIVRRHPNEIAVQKIEVVDEEAALPYLAVYGRDGKLLWQHAKPPLVLTSEVEQLVTGRLDRPAVIASAPRVMIEVTDAGYVPARVEVPHGVPLTLVFTRRSDKTCAVDVHFALPDGRRIDEPLPLGQPVEIPIQIDKPGSITYACGMNMLRGTIDAK